MLVKQGLAMFVADTFASHYKLDEMTVGRLGVAFKAINDDTRSSVSYKLKKLFRAKAIFTTAPNVSADPASLPLQTVLSRSDILVLYAPHKPYRDLQLDGKIVVDVWNLWGVKRGVAVAEA